MNFEEEEKILDIAEQLEDQMFLLHLIQCHVESIEQTKIKNYLIQHNLQSCFLSMTELKQLKSHLCEKLLQASEEDMISIIVRSICSCISLTTSLYINHTQVPKVCTIGEVDFRISKILETWSISSLTELASHLEVITNFLTFFGGIFCLPEGITFRDNMCFFCKFNSALNSNDDTPICSHYLIERPQSCKNQEKEQQEVISVFKDCENVSLQTRFRIRQKQRQVEELEYALQTLKQQFNDYKMEQDYLLTQKQISPFLYSIVGKISIYLEKRKRIFNTFTPQFGGLLWSEAITLLSMDNFQSHIQRLKQCIKRVSFSLTNMNVVHEEFETLSLDPCTLKYGEQDMLRPSVIAKKYILAIGTEPNQIVGSHRERCKLLPEVLVDTFPDKGVDQMFAVVVIVNAYNAWLTTQQVDEALHVKLCRGDDFGREHIHVSFLYDCNKIGFYLNQHTKICAHYNDVFQICTYHLAWISKKRLCATNHIINTILK